MSNFTQKHLEETSQIANIISVEAIEDIVEILSNIKKENGRVFFLGVGGSAANAAHAVNDFRKLADIEAYSPTDNIAEITARTNDEGWKNVFTPWLKTSKLSEKDCIFILSVGGGSKEQKISENICEAIDFAKSVQSKIVGIVGKDGGYTAPNADAVVIIPVINQISITPHTESFQEVIWHLMVSHPKLKIHPTTW
jgi:D-sedoheptulose 7-phosphate isomerase